MPHLCPHRQILQKVILMSNIISLLFNTTVLRKYFRSVIIQAKVALIKSQYTVYRVIFIHFYFCPFSFANGLAPILEIAQTQSCLKSDKKNRAKIKQGQIPVLPCMYTVYKYMILLLLYSLIFPNMFWLQ